MIHQELSQQFIDQEILLVPQEQKSPQIFDSLSESQIYAYGVGHFLNDLTSTILMTYCIIYLTYIEPISTSNTSGLVGLCYLTGQIVDGFSTPIVGVLADKFDFKIGKRKFWYILGFFFNSISFFLLFQGCLICRIWGSRDYSFYYFTILFGLFNFGFALIQVPHMAISTQITCSRLRRDRLNNLRNSFTYLANLIVPSMALIVFNYVENQLLEFQILSYCILGLGITTSLIFIIKINENYLERQCYRRSSVIKQMMVNRSHQSQSINESQNQYFVQNAIQQIEYEEQEKDLDQSNLTAIEVESRHWTYWFKNKNFYQCCFAYMFARVTYMFLGMMLNNYLIQNLKFQNSNNDSGMQNTSIELAIIPLILYLFSFFSSYLSEKLYLLIGRKKTYSLSTFLIVISCSSMLIINENTNWIMFIIAMPLGFGQSLALNTAMTLIGDVIGVENGGAFVFGFYGFVERLANGITVYFVLNSALIEDPINKYDFIRYTVSLIPLVAGLGGWALIVLGNAPDYSQKGVQKRLSMKEEFAG